MTNPTSDELLDLSDKYERILEGFIDFQLYSKREKIAIEMRHLAQKSEILSEFEVQS